jgi:hypothetical protein
LGFLIKAPPLVKGFARDIVGGTNRGNRLLTFLNEADESKFLARRQLIIIRHLAGALPLPKTVTTFSRPMSIKGPKRLAKIKLELQGLTFWKKPLQFPSFFTKDRP